VLSNSTELYDRTGKFEHYRRLKSLQSYLLVSQKTLRVELYERQANDQWLLTVCDGEEGALEISSIGCTLANADIYNKVVLEPGNPLEITRGGLTEMSI
jgi:Uma2 family endonuclease